VGCAFDAAAVPSAMPESLLAHGRRVLCGLHQAGHDIRCGPAGPRLLPLQETRALCAGACVPAPQVHVARATEASGTNEIVG